MTDKVWDHIKGGRENVPVPGKSQYVTDEFIFTCPRCNETISSVHYLNIGYFQIATEEHLTECSKKAAPIISADHVCYECAYNCQNKRCLNVQECDPQCHDCKSKSKCLKNNPIIDVDRDQRDQLTTRLSLRRDK